MKAGFARRNITPAVSMRMAGFDRRTSPSTGCLDPLGVSALALKDASGQPFVFFSYDLLGVDSVLCAAVRKACREALGLAEGRIWVGATHTHSAPSCIFADRENYDADYAGLLVRQGAAAAEEALRDCREAVPFFARTLVKGLASRRNRGRSGADYPMSLLLMRFAREDGALALCRFSCHPTVLDETNTLFSRDLPGAALTAAGAGERILFLNGACADLSTRFTRTASNERELARLGGLLGEGIRSAGLLAAPGLGARIAPAERRLWLDRSAGPSAEERAGLLRVLREKAASCGDMQAKREYDSRIAVLERVQNTADAGREVLLSAVDLGQAVLFSLPFEVDSADGAFLEETLSGLAGKPVYAVCYTGGYDGYLPSGAPLGEESSYEDIASRYGAEARELILECAKQCVLQATAR